jgi:hypothetical protein
MQPADADALDTARRSAPEVGMEPARPSRAADPDVLIWMIADVITPDGGSL